MGRMVQFKEIGSCISVGVNLIGLLAHMAYPPRGNAPINFLDWISLIKQVLHNTDQQKLNLGSCN